MEIIQKRQNILDVLHEIEEELQKHPDTIPEHVFKTMEAFCQFVYASHHSSEKTGWSRKLGSFAPGENKILEHQFSQLGGAEADEAEADSQFEQQYKEFTKILEDIAKQWRQISHSLGIIATQKLQSFVGIEKDGKLLLDKIRTEQPVRQQVSETMLTFFSVFLETIRIWVAYGAMDSSLYRFLLSLSQTFLDAIRGNTRQSLMSSIGLLGRHGYYLSVGGRLLLNMIESISPDLRGQVEFDVYKNIKTLTAGVLLWFYSVFAPETLQYNINQVFKEIREFARKEEIALDDFQESIEKGAAAENLELPDLPLKALPTYSDLQALGELLKMPEVVCTPSFQKLMEPIRKVFTLRVVLDLFNIPTGQIEMEDLCSRERSQTRKNKVSQGGGSDGGERRRGSKKTRRLTAS